MNMLFVLWWRLTAQIPWLILLISDTKMVRVPPCPKRLPTLPLVFIDKRCNTAYTLGANQACRKDGSWHNVKFVGHCFFSPKGSPKGRVFSDSDIQTKKFYHHAEDYEVDFPSIVFVYLPDDGKALYDRIKVMSNM